MTRPLITLLTDFGLADVYVGVMKGVIATIAPQAEVVDLTHQVPPQNVAIANFQLGNAYPYFPADTIHVVVVDPGVGSERLAIACRTDAGIFVAPNNGVLTQVLTSTNLQVAIALTESRYWRTLTPSTTFHGRDIFAPVAAHLANGVSLAALGPEVPAGDLRQLPNPMIQQTDQGIQGQVQAIDHFGNLITNIPAPAIPEAGVTEIHGQQIPVSGTYASVAPDTLISLIGSHGYLEIAVNGGNAQQQLHSQVGDLVFLWTSSPLSPTVPKQ